MSTDRSASTRQRLLDAARRQIVAQGWQAASSRLVTGDAGVPLGSIRYHFGSREAMLAEAAMAEVAAMFATPTRQIVASRTPVELVEALIGWVASAGTSAQQQALLLEVMAHSRRTPELAAALEQSLSGYRSTIADAVLRVVGADEQQARGLADAMAAQANGLWLQMVVEPGLEPAAVCRVASSVWLAALEAG